MGRIFHTSWISILLTILGMTLFPRILPFGATPNVPILIGVYLGFTAPRGTDLILCLGVGYLWDTLNGTPFGMHIGLTFFAFIATFWLKTQFLLEASSARLLCLVGIDGVASFLFALLLRVLQESSSVIPTLLKLVFPEISINLILGIVTYRLLDRLNQGKDRTKIEMRI